ncbi:hypothetical protein GCM10010916_47130 [Paenibacillus abyssi]|uniref:Uncharacterized protein n=1 Tax=Paenibacillus abyssi TaxID=1340531 RepID=A0A917LI14_9BACL|nr:hypothetical protein GCM10010916_47130 [Paenibacillus abyssi]
MKGFSGFAIMVPQLRELPQKGLAAVAGQPALEESRVKNDQMQAWHPALFKCFESTQITASQIFAMNK